MITSTDLMLIETCHSYHNEIAAGNFYNLSIVSLPMIIASWYHSTSLREWDKTIEAMVIYNSVAGWRCFPMTERFLSTMMSFPTSDVIIPTYRATSISISRNSVTAIARQQRPAGTNISPYPGRNISSRVYKFYSSTALIEIFAHISLCSWHGHLIVVRIKTSSASPSSNHVICAIASMIVISTTIKCLINSL